MKMKPRGADIKRSGSNIPIITEVTLTHRVLRSRS